MDDFVKNAFDKAEINLDLAKEESQLIRDYFDDSFDKVMDLWKNFVGNKAANNFCKGIFTFKLEESLTRILLSFFTAGWQIGSRISPQEEAEEEGRETVELDECKAADNALNGKPAIVLAARAAQHAAGEREIDEMIHFAEADKSREDAFVKFVQSLVHIGFHIGWKERGKTK